MSKNYIDKNVYEMALQRIEEQLLAFPDFYISCSGGKDSIVLFHLILTVAKKLNKLPVKVVFSDLEIVFHETIRIMKSIMDMPEVEPYWLCMEELDNNASSVFQRYFKFWGEEDKDKWLRPMPDMSYVINKFNMPENLKKYYKPDSSSEWTITYFGEYLCDKYKKEKILNFIGMRAAESYGRFMNVRAMKHRLKDNMYTYAYQGKLPRTHVCLPIYDWEVEDIWSYYAKNNLEYNKVYDSMYRMGLSLSQMRTCSAFGEEQKNDLWQWCLIEPHTWDKMIIRVAGINFGKLYNHTRLNSMKLKKPDHISWKQYVQILLRSVPKDVKDIFVEKFRITFNYHKIMYREKENISPNIYIQDSRKDIQNAMKKYNMKNKYFICWEDFSNAIIKRDFVFKKYGFGYSNKMENKIKKLYEIQKDKINE